MLEIKDYSIRVSNASTNDMDSSSDEENNTGNCLFESKVNTNNFFSNLSEEYLMIYSTLNEKLEIIYNQLDEEIDPVSIRDELSITANSVNLSSINNSRISRRRSTLITS